MVPRLFAVSIVLALAGPAFGVSAGTEAAEALGWPGQPAHVPDVPEPILDMTGQWRTEVEHDGHIVLLPDPPVVEVPGFLDQVLVLQELRWQELKSLAPGIEKRAAFSTLLNGFHVDVDAAGLEALRAAGYEVWPNVRVDALLDSSTQQIRATQVWERQASGSSVTGSGVRIAILDTGVDYRHPDLGGCLGVEVCPQPWPDHIAAGPCSVDEVCSQWPPCDGESCVPGDPLEAPCELADCAALDDLCTMVCSDPGAILCASSDTLCQILERCCDVSLDVPCEVESCVDDAQPALPGIACEEGCNIDCSGFEWACEWVESGMIDCGEQCDLSFTRSMLGCFGPGCKVAGGYNVVDGHHDPIDGHGHGTHVAAIAAGNGTFRGVAPDAEVWAYKVLHDEGWGYSSWVIEGMERAVDPHQDGTMVDQAHVINLSLGALGGSPDDPLATAADAAMVAGTVVVASAGNNGGSYGVPSIGTPALARGAIAVGAVDPWDSMAQFSSIGPVIWDGQAIMKPEVVAPGVGICAAMSSAFRANNPGAASCSPTPGVDAHVRLSGTSMAAPHVAGAAALALQEHPAWGPAEVRAALMSNPETDLQQFWGFEEPISIAQMGAGRIDAWTTVDRVHPVPVVAIDPVAVGWPGEVHGDIQASGLSHWAASWAPEGAAHGDAAAWTVLAQGTTIPGDRLFVGAGVAAAVPDGGHVLRLEAWDQHGQRGVAFAPLIVQKIVSYTPQSNDILRAGSIVEATVEVRPEMQLSGLRLDYGRVLDYRTQPLVWTPGASSAGADLAWDTSSLPGGLYWIRMELEYEGTSLVEEVRAFVVLDEALRPGFPVRVPDACAAPPCFQGGYNYNGDLVPVAGDTSGDGKQEIAIFVVGEPPRLDLYGHDGALLWSKTVGANAPVMTVPVMADITGDGRMEILVPHQGSSVQVHAYRGDGTQVAGWPATVATPTGMASLAVGDVTGDDAPEVVLRTTPHYSPTRLSVLGADGTLVRSWTLPAVIDTRWWASMPPRLVDLDGDGVLDIVLAEQGKSGSAFVTDVHAYRSDGAALPGWPQRFSGLAGGGPDIVEYDGVPHVLIKGHSTAYMFQPNGQQRPGWPVLHGADIRGPLGHGDLTGDGRPEVILHGGPGYYTYWVYDSSGTLVRQHSAGCGGHYTDAGAMVADASMLVLNRGDVTCHTAFINVPGGVWARDENDEDVAGFPLVTEAGLRAIPLQVDLGHGTKSFVATSASDLMPAWAASESMPGWFSYGDRKQRGSLYAWQVVEPLESGFFFDDFSQGMGAWQTTPTQYDANWEVRSDCTDGVPHLVWARSGYCYAWSNRAEIRSPMVDLSGTAKAELRIDQSFGVSGSGTGICQVETSSDGGSTWQTLIEWEASWMSRPDGEQALVIDHLTGQQLQLRFVAQGDPSSPYSPPAWRISSVEVVG